MTDNIDNMQDYRLASSRDSRAHSVTARLAMKSSETGKLQMDIAKFQGYCVDNKACSGVMVLMWMHI